MKKLELTYARAMIATRLKEIKNARAEKRDGISAKHLKSLKGKLKAEAARIEKEHRYANRCNVVGADW